MYKKVILKCIIESEIQNFFWIHRIEFNDESAGSITGTDQ